MDDAHAISSAARVATVASSSVHTAVVGREARLVGGVNVSACTSTNGAGGSAAKVAVMSPYDEVNVAEVANTFAGPRFSSCSNASLAAEEVDGKDTMVDTTALPAE